MATLNWIQKILGPPVELQTGGPGHLRGLKNLYLTQAILYNGQEAVVVAIRQDSVVIRLGDLKLTVPKTDPKIKPADENLLLRR